MHHKFTLHIVIVLKIHMEVKIIKTLVIIKTLILYRSCIQSWFLNPLVYQSNKAVVSLTHSPKYIPCEEISQHVCRPVNYCFYFKVPSKDQITAETLGHSTVLNLTYLIQIVFRSKQHNYKLNCKIMASEKKFILLLMN